MSWRSFLYRRLSKYIACEMRMAGGGMVALTNKFEVASFQDSVVHPFYWQLYTALKAPPKSVVDVGANCGHFTMIADLCSRILFGESAQHYTLIEPNPYLAPSIARTLHNISITDRCHVIQALVGGENPSETLWIQPKNYLVSSFTETPGAKPVNVSVCAACSVVPEGPIDVLKVDIEGGEYPRQSHLKPSTL